MSEVDRFALEMTHRDIHRCIYCGIEIPNDMRACTKCERKHKKKDKRTKNTLCWKCLRYNCPWIQNATPIKGWTAEPTVVKNKNGSMRSYHVIACPLYKGRVKDAKVTTTDVKDKELPTLKYAIWNNISGSYLRDKHKEAITFATQMDAHRYVHQNLPPKLWDVVEYKED